MKYFTGITTLDDLKAAYRRMAMKHHPDNGSQVFDAAGERSDYDRLTGATA